MAVAKTATKKVAKAAAEPVEKKEEGFLMLIVFKTTHGRLFTKHNHYSSNLLKVKSREDALNHTKAAKRAADTMTERMGVPTEVIVSEKIVATDRDEMHSAVMSKFGGLGKELSEILKAL